MSDMNEKDSNVSAAEKIRKIREMTGMSRPEFSAHTGIPVRTLEDWEWEKRTPPDYIPRLLKYQFAYENLMKEKNTPVGGESDGKL